MRRRGRIYRYYVTREATRTATRLPGDQRTGRRRRGAVLDRVQKLLAAP
jgi:hypothetical protein